MASGFGSVGSVLTERPPSDEPLVTPVARGPVTKPTSPAPQRPVPVHQPQPGNHPAQELVPAAGNRTWYDSLLSGREYDVVYDDAEGYPLLAFADGQWYDVTSFNPRPVSVRYAIHLDPAWAGAVVQTVCSWMRSNPNHDRSFELATELALAMGELARLASG
jgi:hypothetical protein